MDLRDLAAAVIPILMLGLFFRTAVSLGRRRQQRRRLGYGPDHRIPVTVPPEAGPQGRPGFTLVAPSHSAYVRRSWPGHCATQEAAVVIGLRSTLQVVCLGRVLGTPSLGDRAERATTSMTDIGARILQPPAASTLGGQDALRYAVRFASGNELTEWHLDIEGWHYAVGLYCRGGRADVENDRERGEAALSTWRWLRPSDLAITAEPASSGPPSP